MLHQFIGYRRAKKKGAEYSSETSEEIDWEEDHVAFAVGEMGLRLHDFYDMPWCEYLIKSRAYERMVKDKWRHTRFIAYHAHIATHIKMKSIPSMEKFFPIDGERKIAKASEQSKMVHLADYQEYLSKKRK